MKKHRPYLDHSRKEKNKCWIGVKNTIRENPNGNGDLFYSHDYLEEGCDWVDFYFLGKKRQIFYNAFLITPKHALWGDVKTVARQNAEKLVPHTISFVPSKPHCSSIVSSDSDPATDLSPFGGLKRYEWIDKETKRLVQEQEFTVNSHVQLHRDYAYGIGLHGIVDADIITNDVIDSFITEFMANGEKTYVGKQHIATLDMMDISKHMIANSIII